MSSVYVWDLDGTLTTVRSSWEYVHRCLNTWEPSGKESLRKFLAKEITYSEFAIRDAGEWKQVPEQKFLQILNQIPFRKDVKSILDYISETGNSNIIISSGISQLAEIASKRYEIDHWRANEIEVVDGFLTGNVRVQVPWGGKGQVLQQLSGELGFSLDETIVIGDSSSDIDMFKLVPKSIAINPTAEVAKIATHSIESETLSPLLPLLRL